MFEIRVKASGKMAPVRHRHVNVDPLVPSIPMLSDKPRAGDRILEDGGRDLRFRIDLFHPLGGFPNKLVDLMNAVIVKEITRSEERRVGKECRSRGWADH